MISFSDSLALIDGEIRAIDYPRDPAGLYDPVFYLLSMKGKKIRPALTLLACNLYSEDVRAAVYPALAWETFHNFTLMHDDLMDNADLRRGEPSVHCRWNNNTAVLSGDAMLILAYRLIARSPAALMPSLLELFSRTATEICEGQQYDMEFEGRTDVLEEEYIEMVRLKTAVMLGACLMSGAMVGGASGEDCRLLYRFGTDLGIAFQIRDDLLDLYGDPCKIGKRTGGDILCGKKTFLLVGALARADAADRATLLSWLDRRDSGDEKIACFRRIYDGLNVVELAERTCLERYDAALGFFRRVSASEDRKAVLFGLAADLMRREW
ncbi:MAG: polyprenyl synthetase family protein [Dysgonamonadaceae bacterium]|jgi:geranylgeranyl diphosphate synthase type II|nr:polyprenyl synthetase family protein [Dysgonamonadaceae bacterium]